MYRHHVQVRAARGVVSTVAARTNRITSTRRLLGAAIAAVLGIAGTARGDLYWDIDGATPGGGGTAAVGTWGVSNAWSTSAAGDAATGAWVPGETAVFSAGTNVTGAYTVTVDGTQDAAGIRVEEGTLTFSGGALTLSGAAPSLTFASTGHISSALSAANQVTFARSGTSTPNINLNTANTFSGGVLLSERVRINANVAGAIGSGTVTVQGTESSVTNDLAGTSVTHTNNFMLNPLDLVGFSTGFAGAGSNLTTATFAGNISGNADVIISPTPSATNTNTNGSGMTIFTGTNTYSGKTIINMAGAGTFRLGSATALPVGTAVEVGRTNTAQNVGLLDLFGQDISISSLATRTTVLTGAGIGITNSKSGAADQSTITITGGDTTTFAAVIGARTSTSLTNVGGAGTNAGTNNISLTLASSHTGKLTLSGANTYVGDTVVDGGTLVAGRSSLTGNTIAGNVIVNNGGTFGSTATTKGNEYGVGGSITLNSGATLAPGISDSGLVGTSTVRAASLTANDGSTLDFTLFSAANHDFVKLGGGLTLGAGTKTIDVTLLGDTFVATPSNPLVLMTYASLNAAPGDAFTLGADPGDTNPDFIYTLTTEATRVILTAMPTTTTLVWDADAGGGTVADGAGTWKDNGADPPPHFFTDIVTGAETPWSNANNFNTIFGASATGVGGAVALDGNIRTGGKLTFASVATPYTIGDVGETDTLTVAGGITNNAIGTTINAPVVLEASQAFNVGTGGNTLTVNAGIGESTAGLTLTKTGGGTLIINGGMNIGGVNVSEGTLQVGGVNTVGSVTVTGGTLIPLADGALGTTVIGISNNASLRANVPITLANDITVGTGGATFNVQPGADSTYSGNITGTGAVTKSSSGKLTLTGNNTFNGLTIGGQGSGIAVGTDAALGVGPITINNGNTLRAINSFATDNNIITATSDNNSNIDTAGFTVTLSGVISGTGDLLYRGGGRLVLSGANTLSGNVELTDAGGVLETNNVSALGPNGNLIANVNGTLETTSDLIMRDITGVATAVVTKTGAANVSIRRVRDLSTLAIDAGTVTLKPIGTATGQSVLQSLSVAAGAKLDLTDNDVIINYSGASPIAAYEALVASGYNVTGDWQGDGIVSSIAANDGNYVVAIADNATLAAPFGTAQGGPLFTGQDVDLDTILIKFTHRADVNLDGLITPDDSAIFGGNYDENQPAVWATGDMNYDGVFTPDDAAIFGGAYDESLVSLPEPVIASSVLGLAMLTLAGGRRRGS